ncbi:MAG: UDP-N-acetylmuramoyl-L-alanine--D-glutamate ligase [Myxococcales bacterium]|nr:UDP-N-acetylmuramoyl-L-alanine--D-glutamate ligase [Myxococcales bacterium]
MSLAPHDLPWRRALVIGLGASGREAARLLLHLGLEVRVYDRNPEAAIPEGAIAFTGAPEIPAAALDGIELVVLSPGVPPGPHRAAVARHAEGAAIHGEMSLALEIVGRRFPGLPTVLITGTNGKSTVTALTGELLRAGGLDPFTGGNLGVPLSTGILALLRGERRPPGSLVLECSSFQLETMNEASLHRTDVAMVLNVTPDHLDRYPDMDAYADTKARVFAGLAPEGLALLDAGDAYCGRMRAQIPRGRLCLVDDPAGAGATIVGEGPGHTLRLPDGETFARAELGLAGRHNSKNALFALAAARHLGVDHDACVAGLRAFCGLPHRMVKIRELDGVAYYNDSKATNVASVAASLDGFERRFVLIAGGRAKGDDLGPLRALLARQGRALVAIGESADAFAAVADGVVPWARASSMDEAVRLARGLAEPGDAVVLSPACASYDWFANYGERGDVFTRAVFELAPRAAAS